MSDQEKSALVSVKDLAGLSAPLTKLAGTIDAVVGRSMDGTGQVFHTYVMAGKEARNEAERIKLIEDAKTDAMIRRAAALAALGGRPGMQVQTISINSDTTVAAQLVGLPMEVQHLNQRAEQRQAYQNVLHQLNLESVVGIAAEELADEAQVSEEPVKPDWSTRFFNIAQDISEPEAQVLLGKILAGEVRKPGSFSLRTLEVLRNLSQKEAAAFTRACSFFAIIKDQVHLIRRMNKGIQEIIHDYISYSDLATLVDCGLVQGTEQDSMGFRSDARDDDFSIGIRIGKHIVIAKKSGLEPLNINFSKYTPTTAAIELMPLIEVETNINYLLAIAKLLVDEGFKVEYSLFYEWQGEGARYATPTIKIN